MIELNKPKDLALVVFFFIIVLMSFTLAMAVVRVNGLAKTAEEGFQCMVRPPEKCECPK